MKKTVHAIACLFAAGALALTAIPAEAKGKGHSKKPAATKTAKAHKSKG